MPSLTITLKQCTNYSRRYSHFLQVLWHLWTKMHHIIRSPTVNSPISIINPIVNSVFKHSTTQFYDDREKKKCHIGDYDSRSWIRREMHLWERESRVLFNLIFQGNVIFRVIYGSDKIMVTVGMVFETSLIRLRLFMRTHTLMNAIKKTKPGLEFILRLKYYYKLYLNILTHRCTFCEFLHI